MNAPTDTGPTAVDALDDAAAVVAGLGMITLVLFPLALPAIILAAVAVVPLVALALLLAVVSAVMAPPILAVRGLRRRSRSRRAGVTDLDGSAAKRPVRPAPSARVSRP